MNDGWMNWYQAVALLREWIEHADVVGEVRVVLGDLRGGEEVYRSVVPVNKSDTCFVFILPEEKVHFKQIIKNNYKNFSVLLH